MGSNFEQEYQNLRTAHSLLKPAFTTVEDELKNLINSSTHDDLSKYSALVATSIDDAHSSLDNYRHVAALINERISTMADKQDEIGKYNDEVSRYEDEMGEETNGLSHNPVLISSYISQFEKRYTRVLNNATSRVIALSRFLPNPSSLSIPSNQTITSHDNHNTASVVDGAPSSNNFDDPASLLVLYEKIHALENKLDNTSSLVPTHSPNVSLPPIKLETFDGSDITKWSAYKYQLDCLILSQTHLNEVEKAYYIRSSLRGNALSLVSTIPTQKDFLAKIIERLELEFGRSDLTQATLLKSLLEIRSKSTSVHDQIQSVRSMINLAHTIDESCGLNSLLIQQQLADHVHPRFITLVWKRKPATLLSALQLIEDTLRSELEDVTIMEAISEQNKHTQNNVASYPNNSGTLNKSPKSTSSNKQSPPRSLKGPACVFCGQHAYSGECTTVKSPKDRKNVLRNKSLCHCCFSNKHATADCSKSCPNCKEKHHKTLCEKPSPTSMNTLAVDAKQPERLFTVKAKVANADTNKVISAHVHLDHGAQATIISRKLVDRLSLVPFEQREMTISGINSESAISSIYDIVNVVVVTSNGHYPIEAVVQESTSVNSIHTLPLHEADLAVIKSTLGYIPRHFSHPHVVHTDLLLSVGDTLELLENSKETKLPGGYRLVQSSIGPLVVGSNKPRNSIVHPVVSALTVHTDTDESLEQKIERLFSVDPAARVYDTTEKEARKASDELVNKHFDDTIEKRGDEYFVQYSVKPEAQTDLPTNYDLATSRLCSTIRTLSKQRSNLEFYDTIIQDQLNLGQIEMVDPSDTEGIIHYLAHQPVLRPDKPTTPLRIVYDASAHLKNRPCLNDMIHPGPSDLEQIPALLLRARSRAHLIVADVEKAFLQVKLHPSQRNMLRFLWVKDLDKPVTRQNILILRFCVTPFGVNASPSLLNKVITHHVKLNSQHYDPDLIQQLMSNLYVDNVIINIDHPTSLMYTQSKSLFDTMSMNLRDYSSNHLEFINNIPESDRSKDQVQKVLGLQWNSSSDTLSIKIPVSDKSEKVTKRSMLSAASTPYDPLGLLNPLILPARLTIQGLWNTSLKWDEQVDDNTRDIFHGQMRDLEDFSLSIDRFSHLSDSNEITLVAFSDASKVAMATCVYNWSSNSTPTLLISKTRLAPIKSKSTIPKMELDSLVMSHSLIRFTVDALRKEFPDKPIHIYFYSDSAVVLHWCKPDFSKPLGVFATNRVKKIHEIREELSSQKQIIYHQPRHVRSEDNPADHATRGLTARDMNNPKHQWWTGPEWLTSCPNSWPNEALSSLQCPILESYPINVSAVTVDPTIETVIDLTEFSSLRRAITVTAYVNRYISRLASKTKNPIIQEKLKYPQDSDSLTLSSKEKRFALNSIIRRHQYKYIHSNDPLKISNAIFQDSLTHLWKTNTRLTNSHLNSEAKAPVFIPSNVDSTLARLIISDIHQSSSHSNLDVILNQVKRRFWIPRCRQIAKSVLKQCVPCRKTNNLPFRYPPSPVLPSDRVRQSRPFEHCGIDYAGPFHSNKDEKMYVVVITCFSTRLSHLEVVDSLLPSSFILAFKRFCSRRGTPRQITSDKATTFKMASTLFSKPEEDPDVNTLMTNLGIRWNFTTAHSPWKGGIYERLVKILKDSISRSIGRKKLSSDEFSTVICEIEALLNSRPLTYVSSDDVHSFSLPALRPIDLISPESFLGCPIILSDADDDYRPPEDDNSSRETAIKQLKRSIDIVETFWKRWHNEYLTTLRDCSSKSDPLHASRSTTLPPSVGSLVLIVDESGNTPRSTWKMAKILALTENSATLRSHAGRTFPIASGHDYSLPSYEDITQPATKGQPEISSASASSTSQPAVHYAPPVKQPKRNTAKMSKEIAEFLDPLLAQTLADHKASIILSVSSLVDDLMTVVTKSTTDIRSSIHDVSTAVSTLSNFVHSSVPSPSVHNRTSRDHNDTPTTSRSRARVPVAAHRSRSRSPHQIRTVHSRSPVRIPPKPTISQQKLNRPPCAFCKENHFSKDCNRITSLSTRLSIMRSENRCRKCFRVLDQTHFPTCEPPLCYRHCKDHTGRLERHSDDFCPQNPKLTL